MSDVEKAGYVRLHYLPAAPVLVSRIGAMLGSAHAKMEKRPIRVKIRMEVDDPHSNTRLSLLEEENGQEKLLAVHEVVNVDPKTGDICMACKEDGMELSAYIAMMLELAGRGLDWKKEMFL